MTTGQIAQDCASTCGLSQAAGRFRGEKGCGTQLWVDFAACTAATLDTETGEVTLTQANAYDEICCVRSITPVGYTRDVETDEGCLCDLEEYDELGPSKRTNMTITFRDQLTMFDDDNISVAGVNLVAYAGNANARDAFQGNSIVSFVQKTPIWICNGTSGCRNLAYLWQVWDGRLVSYVPGNVEKKTYKESVLTVLPTSRVYGLLQATGAVVGKKELVDAAFGTMRSSCGCGVVGVDPFTAPEGGLVIPEGALGALSDAPAGAKLVKAKKAEAAKK